MESLGNKLKSAREEKGWDFESISRETNISARYLEALEREDFSGFPGEPYVLGFLKNYGEHLGLNPDELLSLYSALKIEEQPVPVEQLLKGPSRAPKIIKGTLAVLFVLGLAAAGYFFISRMPDKPEAAPLPERNPGEYPLNTDFLERRFYPGDSVLVSDGTNSYKLLVSGLNDTVTITTPRGPVMLDLAQELTADLNDDGFDELRITAVDFVKNDSALGARLRFEQETPPRTTAAEPAAIPLEPAARDAATLIFSAPSPYPFTLQAVFQGYCLFRYEILFERDRPERNEQYYQRSMEVTVSANNGIRLGISNAQAVRLQVIGGGRTVPLETGSAGEVVAADIRWVRDEDNRYRLVLLRLE